jgi:hypothetical protein
LLAGYRAVDPETRFPAFAFRLHQFISRGDTAYASLEAEDRRHITLQAQQYVPGDREKVLLPLVFCRECGQEYYCVEAALDPETRRRVFTPRELSDRTAEGDGQCGFLYYSSRHPWPECGCSRRGARTCRSRCASGPTAGSRTTGCRSIS